MINLSCPEFHNAIEIFVTQLKMSQEGKKDYFHNAAALQEALLKAD